MEGQEPWQDPVWKYGPEVVGDLALKEGGLLLCLMYGSQRTILAFGKVFSIELLSKEAHTPHQDVQKDMKYIHAEGCHLDAIAARLLR